MVQMKQPKIFLKQYCKFLSYKLRYTCIDRGLKLLHPMMPFITEELYQRLPHPDFNISESICIAPFPTDTGFINQNVEERADLLFELTHKINIILTQFPDLKNKKPKICLFSTDKEILEFFYSERVIINALTKTENLTTISDKNDKSVQGWLVNVVNSNTDIYLDVISHIDVKKEVKL